MSLIIACATNDCKNLYDNHFGDADKYLIVEITKSNIIKKNLISNEMKDFEEEEQEHGGDPKKAGGVGALLKKHNVNTILGNSIGPNVINIIKKFAVVVSRDKNIETALMNAHKFYDNISTEFNKKENRKHIVLENLE